MKDKYIEKHNVFYKKVFINSTEKTGKVVCTEEENEGIPGYVWIESENT